AEESLFDQFGDEAGISQDPSVLQAADAARREYLLTRIAQSFFLDEVAVTPEIVEAEYHYRNTAILLRYLALPDRLTALDYRRRLEAGERFESLALQAFTPQALLDSPGQPGWRYPHQMDSLSARLAYRLAPGEISQPLRVGHGFLVMELLGKEFRPDHGHFERVKRLQGINEELWPSQRADAAQQSLRQWAKDLPYKWRRRGLRKVIRAGLLAAPLPSGNVPQGHPLADEQLFSLSTEGYTLDWLLAGLALLPPGTFTGITDLTGLQAVCG
ncbi:MAG: peptidylprolyl isomerase, partial [Candidatus Neomarinimicrobiota bacterium]